MPVDPETLRDLLSANDRHADIIHSESSDESITRARVYKSRKIVRTGTVKVHFVDQMSVSNSENEDILSFGQQQRYKQDKFRMWSALHHWCTGRARATMDTLKGRFIR